MADKGISSGIRQLDRYIGGLRKGDSLLWVVDTARSIRPIMKAFAEHCAQNHVPLFSLNASDPSPSDFLRHYARECVCLTDQGGWPAVSSKARAFLRRMPKNGCVVVEELSAWKRRLRNEKRVLDFFQEITSGIATRSGVVVASVVRSNLSHAGLVALQSHATVVLELIERQNEFFCVPILTKDRYVSRRLFPLRLDIAKLASSERAAITHGGETGGIPERLAERIRRDYLSSTDGYVDLFENASEPMVLFEGARGHREFNRRFAEVLGCTREELRNTNLLAMMTSGNWGVLRLLAELPLKRARSFEIALRKKNGKSTTFEAVFSPLKGGWHLCVLHDVSRWQAREVSLREEYEELLQGARKGEQGYRSLIEESPSAIAVISGERITYANLAFSKTFGCASEGDVRSRSIFEFLTSPSVSQLRRLVRTAASGTGDSGTAASFVQLEGRRSDGSTFLCELNVSPTTFGGKAAVRVLLNDITIRQKAFGELAAAERRLRAAFERATEPIALVRAEQIIQTNEAFLKLFGFKADIDIRDMEITDFVESTDREEVVDEFERVCRGKKEVGTIQTKALRSAGESFDVELTFRVIDREDEPLLVVFFADITERLQAKVTYERTVEQVAILREVAVSGYSSLEFTKILNRTLQRTIQCLSFDAGGVYTVDTSKKILSLRVHRDLPEKIATTLATLAVDEGIGGLVAKTEEPHRFSLDHYPRYLPHKTLFGEAGVQSLCLLPLTASTGFVGMLLLLGSGGRQSFEMDSEFLKFLGLELGSALEKASLATKLQEAVDRHRRLIESLNDIVLDRNPDGSCIFMSPNVETQLGYRPEDFRRKKSFWQSIIHPDDKAVWHRFLANIDSVSERSVLTYRVLPRGKAEYRWIEETVALERNAVGQTLAIHGFMRDITHLRRTEEALQTSEGFRSFLLEAPSEGIATFDENLICTEWSSGFARMTGIAREDAIGRDALSLLADWAGPDVPSHLQHCLAGSTTTIDETSVKRSESEAGSFLALRFVPIRGADARVTGIACVATDVGKIHLLREKVRESEQVLQNVVDTMGDPLVLTDLQGTVLEVNREFLRLLGYSRAEVVGTEFPYPWLIEEEMGRFVLWIASLREKSYLRDFDMTWKGKDGRLVPMSLTTTMLRNSYGEQIAMLNVARDITERQKLTAELQARTRQLELINRVISRASETMDLHQVFKTVASETRDVVPYDQISVALLSSDGHDLEAYSAMYDRPAISSHTRRPLERTVSQFALTHLEPVIVSDSSAEEQFGESLPGEEGFRSQITLPFGSKGRALGTLSLVSKQPNRFGENEARLLTPLAQQLGTVVDRMLLFKQVSEDAEYIHNLLDSIGNAVFTIDERKSVRESNKSWHHFVRRFGKTRATVRKGTSLHDTLVDEKLASELDHVADRVLQGSLEDYSGELMLRADGQELLYHVTANPITIEGKITGVVFTYTDITELKRTEAELKRRNEQLLLLHEISSTISKSLDLEEVLAAVVPRLSQIVRSDVNLLYLVVPGQDELALSQYSGIETDIAAQGLRLPITGTLTGTSLLEKETIYIEEGVKDDPRVHEANRALFREFGLEAMAIVPLRMKDRVLGVLDLIYKEPHKFLADERQLLGLIGNHLGSAIESAQLYSQLRKQIDRLTVLYALSRELTATLEVDVILNKMHESVKEVIPFDHLAIHLYSEEHEAALKALERSQSELQPTIRCSAQRFGEEAPERKVILQHGSVRELQNVAGGHEQLTATMCVPMMANQRILGIISCRCVMAQGYSDTQLRLLESIGNLGAIAIEKAQLYEQIVEKSNEVLRRNKELDDFTYVVSHDLKEPLITIEGYSKMLLKDFQQGVPEEAKGFLDTISRSSARMKRLIEDLLVLSRVGRVTESFKPVAMHDIITEALSDLEFAIRRRNVRLIVQDEMPEVLGNETHLQILFRNLISNAVKFNTSAHPVVEIGSSPGDGSTCTLFVRDNGIGIDKEFFERIFTVFQRLHSAEEYEGTGAGLAIVKKIIEMHHGKIWVESEVGRGSTFYVTLPQHHRRKAE